MYVVPTHKHTRPLKHLLSSSLDMNFVNYISFWGFHLSFRSLMIIHGSCCCFLLALWHPLSCSCCVCQPLATASSNVSLLRELPFWLFSIIIFVDGFVILCCIITGLHCLYGREKIWWASAGSGFGPSDSFGYSWKVYISISLAEFTYYIFII